MKRTKSILILLSLFLIFSCGEKDGKRTEYYSNGQIKEERIFKDGEWDGKCIYLCEEGVTECYYQGDLDVLQIGL